MSTPSASLTSTVANGWIRRHPSLTSRIAKAVEIVNMKKVLPAFSTGVFLVEASAGYSHYRVVLPKARGQKATCTCPDHQNGHKCKHILAVALLSKVGSLPSIPPVSYSIELPSEEAAEALLPFGRYPCFFPHAHQSRRIL